MGTMHRQLKYSFACLLLTGTAVACGARSELIIGSGPGAGAGAGEGGTGGVVGTGGTVGGGGAGGEGGVLTCLSGEVLACGTEVGECVPGLRYCVDDIFGPCEGAIDPIDELCNALDDDCDGQVDNGFGLGQACDGADSDLCLDDVMSCEGCSVGPSNAESCNGVDDNCNGITDSDCDFGDCQPSLLVTGSTPSSPNCINFPVEAGSTGTIQYPCTGGPVSAVLGSIAFSGSVTNGQVMLTGTEQLIGPDNCLWQMDHEIQGSITSGTLSYAYWETLLSPPPGCWSPCTEVGTVAVQW
jgi:hypothetical protein